jgi:3-deoxy-D-manno-octulosonic-acid transferase
VSARVSPRALRRYLWVKPLFSAALGRFAAICAQSEDDAARLRELGAPAERVYVTGNLKAERGEASAEPPALDLGERVVLVAASTQPGEEAFVLAACERVWMEYPQVLLVLAPRRPERFDEVASLLEQRGVPFERRSASETAVAAHSKCLLLDSLGELAGFLPLARACFVGGTVAPIGGHNVLEPATAGAAVSFGPHLDNVEASAEALCSASAAVRVTDAGELAGHWRELIARPERAREMGERARAVAAELAGAVPATLAVIAPLLGFAP